METNVNIADYELGTKTTSANDFGERNAGPMAAGFPYLEIKT